MQLNAGMAKLHPCFLARYSYPLRRRLSTAEERRLESEQETARCYYTAMRFEINQYLQIINQIYTLYLGLPYKCQTASAAVDLNGTKR